jgi:hypothetical protein
VEIKLIGKAGWSALSGILPNGILRYKSSQTAVLLAELENGSLKPDNNRESLCEPCFH